MSLHFIGSRLVLILKYWQTFFNGLITNHFSNLFLKDNIFRHVAEWEKPSLLELGLYHKKENERKKKTEVFTWILETVFSLSSLFVYYGHLRTVRCLWTPKLVLLALNKIFG